ncbi:Cytochrome P450 [Naviculisporaceae sp. PSN 640]
MIEIERPQRLDLPPIILLAVIALIAVIFLIILHLLYPKSKTKYGSKYCQSKLDKQASTQLFAQVPTVGLAKCPRFLRAFGLQWPLTLLSSITNLTANTLHGFNTFSKRDLPFILPTTWPTNSRLVILPPSQLHSIMNKPESELSGFWALIEHLMLHHFIDIEVFDNLIHFEVSKKDLGRTNVHRQASATVDEIERAFGDIWGRSSKVAGDEKTEKGWKTVNGWDACTRVIVRVGMRTLVGEEMCRDDNLLTQTALFSNAFFAGVAILHCTPEPLRWLVGAFVSLPTKWYGSRCRSVFIPLVKRRVELWKDRERRIIRGEKAEDLPNDFLQWLITRCASHGPQHLDPHKITTRMLALNTMFVFAMGYVFAHAVIDICASPNRDKITAGLREESERVIREHPEGLANREVIDKLYRADSTLRESMRLSAISVVSLPRDVVGSQPLDIGNGVSIPPGTRIAFPTLHMQLDFDLYTDAGQLDPFRFSRPAEEHRNGERRQDLMYTPTPGFLAFGYGRKACPGRWYVSQTLKQALAYLVVNYDVELVGSLPERKALLNTMIPPTGTMLRIRRRNT